MLSAHPTPFAQLLDHYLRCCPKSRVEIARRAGVDTSYLFRLVSGERRPPRREVVPHLAEALELGPVDAERLLLAAGYAPDWAALLAAGGPRHRHRTGPRTEHDGDVHDRPECRDPECPLGCLETPGPGIYARAAVLAEEHAADYDDQ